MAQRGPLLCNCISVMLRSHLHRQKIPLIQYLFEIPKLLGTWVCGFFFLSEPESGCRFYSTRITRSSFVNLWGSISDVVLRWMSCHNIILLYDIVCVCMYLGTCFIHFCISTLSTDRTRSSPSMSIKNDKHTTYYIYFSNNKWDIFFSLIIDKNFLQSARTTESLTSQSMCLLPVVRLPVTA